MAFLRNFLCNITFNHSNYVIVGGIAKTLFSTCILGILKVNVSYDLRHLELANPISEETLQTHSLRHLQYGMRNVFIPFPVVFCYVILSLSHISAPCSTLRKLCGTYAVDALCSQQHTSLTADNTEPSSYTLQSIVDCQIQPKTPRKFSCKSQVPVRVVSGTKRDC